MSTCSPDVDLRDALIFKHYCWQWKAFSVKNSIRKYCDRQPCHILKYQDKFNEHSLRGNSWEIYRKKQGLKCQINRTNHPFSHGVKAALYWLMRINYWDIDSTKKALYWCSQRRWLILNTAFAGKNVIKVKTQIPSQFPSEHVNIPLAVMLKPSWLK